MSISEGFEFTFWRTYSHFFNIPQHPIRNMKKIL